MDRWLWLACQIVERPRPSSIPRCGESLGNLYDASLPSLHAEVCKINEVDDWNWRHSSPRHGAGSLRVAEEVSRNSLSLTWPY
jgi:hypothetical protein